MGKNNPLGEREEVTRVIEESQKEAKSPVQVFTPRITSTPGSQSAPVTRPEVLTRQTPGYDERINGTSTPTVVGSGVSTPIRGSASRAGGETTAATPRSTGASGLSRRVLQFEDTRPEPRTENEEIGRIKRVRNRPSKFDDYEVEFSRSDTVKRGVATGGDVGLVVVRGPEVA